MCKGKGRCLFRDSENHTSTLCEQNGEGFNVKLL
jgi:hypothetical protein